MTDCGLYIHIPFCEKRCNYCDFYSTTQFEDFSDRYIDEVCNEIKGCGKIYNDARITTIYIGGGTPSLLSVSQLEKIFSAVSSSFSTNSIETTIEVNPNSSQNIADYTTLGIDRISIGVQSLNDSVLKKLGRLHDAETAKDTLKRASRYFDKISADIIIGADEQEDIEGDIAFFSDYCNHISGYLLTVADKTPLKKMIKAKEIVLPDEDETVRQYNRLVDACRAHSLYRYETSNFACLGGESKHNSGYWAMKPYLGVGASAHSYYDERRFYNVDNLEMYLSGMHSGNGKAKTERRPSVAAAMQETVMLALRTRNGLDIDKFNRKFNVDFCKKFSSGLKKAEKYIFLSPDKLYILPQYFLVQNRIIFSILTD